MTFSITKTSLYHVLLYFALSSISKTLLKMSDLQSFKLYPFTLASQFVILCSAQYQHFKMSLLNSIHRYILVCVIRLRDFSFTMSFHLTVISLVFLYLHLKHVKIKCTRDFHNVFLNFKLTAKNYFWKSFLLLSKLPIDDTCYSYDSIQM